MKVRQINLMYAYTMFCQNKTFYDNINSHKYEK